MHTVSTVSKLQPRHEMLQTEKGIFLLKNFFFYIAHVTG